MAGMGPAPKNPDRRARTNATVAMTRLPASGRSGRAPAWPFGADLSVETAITLGKRTVKALELEVADSTVARERAAARRKLDRARESLARAEAMKTYLAKNERELWRDLWKTPQATQWAKLGWTRDVAQYVRHKVKAESGSLDDAKEARQLSDRLGLSPLAMLRLRWEVVDDTTTQSAPAARSRRNSSRYRDLKVVQ